MRNKTKFGPTKSEKWDQGDQNLTVGKGICFGLCKSLAKDFKNTKDSEKFYDALQGSLFNKTTRTLQSGINAQEKLSKWGATTIKPPFPDDTILLINCNISVSSGSCTRYSLSSYLNPFSYMGNHSCLLRIGGDGGVVLFEPN